MPATSARLLNGLRTRGQWLFVEPRLAWTCALIVASAVLVCVGCKSELAIRSVGMILELLGLFVAGWGLIETRRDFDKPSLRKLAKNWWAARPKGGYRQVSVHDSLTPTLTETARVQVWTIINPDALLEERFAALVENVERLRRDLTRVEDAGEALAKCVQHGLKQESEARAELERELRGNLKSVMTDGLLVALVGLVWVFLGSILSTMSLEISCLLLTQHLPSPSGCALAQITLGVRRSP